MLQCRAPCCRLCLPDTLGNLLSVFHRQTNIVDLQPNVFNFLGVKASYSIETPENASDMLTLIQIFAYLHFEAILSMVCSCAVLFCFDLRLNSIHQRQYFLIFSKNGNCTNFLAY